MSTAGSASGTRQALHRRALDGRQIALNVDDNVVFAGGVDRAQRLEDPVRAGLMVRAGQDRLAPGRLDRRDDARIVGRDENRPDVGFDRAPPDMGDHRLAADVGERLARQAAGRHARGDEDDGIDHD